MGGKSKKDDSMMQFQMQQAAEARQKEAERKQRLEEGTNAINTSFAGFDQPFYDKYKNAYLTDQLPQLDKQFADAQKKLTFDAADAGNLRSRAVGEANANLAEDYDANKGRIGVAADSATGDYRNSVQTQKNAVVSQLYGTEDPTQAANNATSVVQNLNQLSTPTLPSLASMFTPIIVGAGGAYQGYQDTTALNKALAARSPSASSGKVVT